MKNLGDRMKENYENRFRFSLTRRTPVIMRLDGRAFHTLTRGCKKPFDEFFSLCMTTAAINILEDIQGAQCAYVQSDEISILITDYTRFETQAWFNYNIQKMCSVGASLATVGFNHEWYIGEGSHATFDCRVFNLPKEEVNNYFIWRQKDWERNSLFMYANSMYSAKSLHGKSNADKHEMIFRKGYNWADLDDKWKNGVFIISLGVWTTVPECPIFTQSHIINELLKPEEE